MSPLEEKKYKIQDLIDLVASLRNEGVQSAQEHNTHASKETLDMFQAVNSRLDKLTDSFSMVSDIHNCIFGVNGVGGMAKDVKDTKEQALKTNGRVNRLEMWKQYIIGGLSIVSLIGLPLLWQLYTDVRTDSQIITAHMAQSQK